MLRERIILAYLGLADRLANRYRHSRGTTLEDLTQAARAGLIAAIDRYDPAKGQVLSPSPWPVWSANSSGICGTPAGGCMYRPRKEYALRLCKALDELEQRSAAS